MFLWQKDVNKYHIEIVQDVLHPFSIYHRWNELGISHSFHAFASCDYYAQDYYAWFLARSITSDWCLFANNLAAYYERFSTKVKNNSARSRKYF